MKTTVKNTSKANQGVWTDEGLVHIGPGESREVTIAKDYVERFKALPYFSTGEAGPALEVDLAGLDANALVKLAVAEGMFESEDIILDDLRRAITSKREFDTSRDPLDHDADGEKGGMAESEAEIATAEDIVSAVGRLDAKNDDHWTSAGLPAVEAVREIAGKDVTRKAITEAAPDAKRPEQN